MVSVKAVQINRYGGAEVLEVKDNVSPPTPKKGQLLIDVHAAGINPFDIKVLSGAYKDMIPLQFPVTFGGDFAGVVTQTGEEVYGTAIVLSGGSGAFAQKACAVAGKIAHKPKTITYEQAAALPVAGLTAVEAILDQIKLQKDQKILIHGGAGGVGHFAIQIAKSIGAHVFTTAASRDFDFVKQLGADQVIDYKTQSFEKLLKNVDAVLDTVGGETSSKSYTVLRPGGVLVLLVSQVDEKLAEKHMITVIRQQSKTDTQHLKRLADLVDSGKIRVNVDRVFPLEQVKEAFNHLESGHPRGKVVLKIV